MWPVYLVITYFVLALVVPVLWSTLRVYSWARAVRKVTCPADLRAAEVQTDALYTIKMNLTADPRLRVRTCSRWPGSAGCHEECLHNA